MTTSQAALWQYRDLVFNLVARDLRVKYKGSTLGFAWSLLHPLLIAGVYSLAFQYVLRIEIEYFPLFLLSGLLPWMFLSTAVSSATASVVDHGALVRKVAFPRLALPVGAVLSQFVQFWLMFAVIIPLAVLIGPGLSVRLLSVVPVALCQLALVLGLGLMLAAAYVRFRDVRHLVDVALQLWFWLTPVVYPFDRVPPDLQPLVALNPMTAFVTSYQDLVLGRGQPTPLAVTAMLASASVSLAVGLMVFGRQQHRFAELT